VQLELEELLVFKELPEQLDLMDLTGCKGQLEFKAFKEYKA
jgi:hypothetical protein